MLSNELLRDVSAASNSYSRDDRHVLDIIDKVSLHTPQEYFSISITIIIGDELGPRGALHSLHPQLSSFGAAK